MHTTVTKDDIIRGLDITARISVKHQTLPVLQCVLLHADTEGFVTIRATNLELGASVTIPARVETGGTVAVPSGVLQQTISLINERDVTLKVESDTLIVSSGKSHTVIKIFPHDEFPNIPQLTGAGQVVHGGMFALGIKTAAFAASHSSIKPELGSVYIHQQREHTLTFVATDAFRLVEKTVPQKGVTLDAPLLIPSKNALELTRICELVGEDPEMVSSENQLALRFPNGTYITTRLTEASFPDYQQIMPKEFALEATVLRGDLMHALKKTNIFTNAYLQVRMEVDPQHERVLLSSDNGDLGKTEESLTAAIEGSDTLVLSFNQRYLTEPLAAFVDDSVTLRCAGVGRPMVIEGVSDRSLRYLVMPMNR